MMSSDNSPTSSNQFLMLSEILSKWIQPSQQVEHWWQHPQIVSTLLISQGIALLWWGVALMMMRFDVIVWHDNLHTFWSSPLYLANPYESIGFVSPPWVGVIMIPFRLLPFQLAVLVQSCLYFGAMAAALLKFGGERNTVLLTLFSYFGLDAVLQMNIDWMVVIGLLLPIQWGVPLILAKPQLAVGYYLGIPPRQWLKVTLVAVVLLGVSFAVWGNWVMAIWQKAQLVSIPRDFNIAPLNFMPVVSILIAIALGWLAFRKQDPVLGILACFFVTPYFAPYSLIIPFGMLALRIPRLALIINGVTWIVIGGTAVSLIIRSQML